MQKDIIPRIKNLNTTSPLHEFLEVFNYDLKDELQFVKANNNIEKIMSFFAEYEEPQGLEYREVAKALYDKLGWGSNKYFDVLSSFWTIYSCALAVYDTFEIPLYKLDEANNRVIMDKSKKNDVSQEYVIIDHNIFAKAHRAYYTGREPYIGNRHKDKKKIYNEIKELHYMDCLACVTHSIPNFMPCPDAKFNSAKGCLSDVKDFLPLMVDKIEYCISNNISLLYGDSNEVSISELKAWKRWLIENRTKYFFDEQFYVTVLGGVKKMIGIPLFGKQTLNYPVPRLKDELEDCVNEMIRRIRVRCLKMLLQIIT